ncbi:hypothetical protein HY029_05455 [Candidatus Gottesmanbacteria bacterium]|nr:hypothetical protein [Candidatus Gottesmanbacteria bacterium]
MPKSKKQSKVGQYLYKILFFAVRWITELAGFIFIILKPVNLIGILLTIISIYYAQTQSGTNRLLFDIISAFIASISGGIVGYYIIDYFQQFSLKKKSIGAIRNLQLIKYKVTNISDRIVILLNNQNKRDFQEIDNLVQNVHKDILNSISDWGDVNPTSEAITDYYEIVNQKQKAIASLSDEKNELVDKLKILSEQKESIDKNKTGEIEKLSKEIDAKEDEIKGLKNQLNTFNFQNIGIASGTLASNVTPTLEYPSTFTSTSSTLYTKACLKCGNPYFPIGEPDSGLCSRCSAI